MYANYGIQFTGLFYVKAGASESACGNLFETIYPSWIVNTACDGFVDSVILDTGGANIIITTNSGFVSIGEAPTYAIRVETVKNRMLRR